MSTWGLSPEEHGTHCSAPRAPPPASATHSGRPPTAPPLARSLGSARLGFGVLAQSGEQRWGPWGPCLRRHASSVAPALLHWPAPNSAALCTTYVLGHGCQMPGCLSGHRLCRAIRMATERRASTQLLNWAVSSLLRTPGALGEAEGTGPGAPHPAAPPAWPSRRLLHFEVTPCLHFFLYCLGFPWQIRK